MLPLPMAAGIYNFEIEQGATFDETWTWTDSANVAVPLSGWTATLVVATTLFTSPSKITLGATDGTIHVLLSATDTNSLLKGKQNYYLKLVRTSDNYTKKLLKGYVVVD